MATRDGFRKSTRTALASRVAWQCSRPGCRRLTIGPKRGESRGFLTAGESAHITAAAPGGPRYDERLTSAERRDIGNGIWLCSVCADIIDRDELNYSASTLRQWRALAERAAHESFAGSGGGVWAEPTTFVQFGFDVVVEAVWLGGQRDQWSFGVRRFIIGDENDLIHFLERDEDRFIIVESQGDGRVVSQEGRWERAPGFLMTVSFGVLPRNQRIDARDSAIDLALGDDGDLVRDDTGDLAMLSGEAAAVQAVRITLSIELGSWVMHPEAGSRWQHLAFTYRTNTELLSRLLLLDFARLLSVPVMDSVGGGSPDVEVNFIERIESLSVLQVPEFPGELVTSLVWRWASSKQRWSGQLKIPLGLSPPGPADPVLLASLLSRPG